MFAMLKSNELKNRECRKCKTYASGMCGWYDFGDNRPPFMFSPAKRCDAFRTTLEYGEKYCANCAFFISTSGYLGLQTGGCIVDGVPVKEEIPIEVKAQSYLGEGIFAATPKFMSYMGFYGFEYTSIKMVNSLFRCDRFQKRVRSRGGLTITPINFVLFLTKRGKRCPSCGRKVYPSRKDGENSFACPKDGGFLIQQRRGVK